MELVCSCFEEVTDKDQLKEVLHEIRPLRVKFLKETGISVEDINYYVETVSKGFYSFTSKGYILGKYFEISGNGVSLPIAYVSELYVKPEFRKCGIARNFLFQLSLYNTLHRNSTPIMLGCVDNLVKFYEHLNFVSVKCKELIPNSNMMFLGNDTKLGRLTKILE